LIALVFSAAFLAFTPVHRRNASAIAQSFAHIDD
jgi:hypothetical protein